MASNNWSDSASDIRKFLNILIDAEVLQDTDDVQTFVNKPQQYNGVYQAWDDAGFPDSEDENWDDFVSAVTEDSDES